MCLASQIFYHYVTNLFYKDRVLNKTDRLVSVLVADLSLIENMILNSAYHFFHFCGPSFISTVSFKRWWGIQLLFWLAMHTTENHGSYSVKEEDTAN